MCNNLFFYLLLLFIHYGPIRNKHNNGVYIAATNFPHIGRWTGFTYKRLRTPIGVSRICFVQNLQRTGQISMSSFRPPVHLQRSDWVGFICWRIIVEAVLIIYIGILFLGGTLSSSATLYLQRFNLHEMQIDHKHPTHVDSSEINFSKEVFKVMVNWSSCLNHWEDREWLNGKEVEGNLI